MEQLNKKNQDTVKLFGINIEGLSIFVHTLV